MLSKNYKKRGFTIVELVIVIAVIAILSAILIPTFVNLIDKAKRSADQRAIANLNEVVAVEEAQTNLTKNDDGLFNVNIVYDLVKEHNLVPDYTPLTKDLDSCYDNTTNRFMLYEKKSGNVVFPKNLVKTTAKIENVQNEYDPDNPVRGFFKLGAAIVEAQSDGQYRFTRDKENEYKSLLEKNMAGDGEPENYQPLTGINKSNYGKFGLYYKDGILCNETVSDSASGKSYTYENGMLVVDAEITNVEDKYSTTITIPSDIDANYKTKEVIVKATPDEEWFSGVEFEGGVFSYIEINIDESNYNLTDVNSKFSLQQKIDRLELIVKNMHSGDETIRDSAFKEAKEFIDDIYQNDMSALPNITKSNNFNNYLKIIGINPSNLYENYNQYYEKAFSKEAYSENNANMSFSTYLCGKYGVSGLIGNDYNLTNLAWSCLIGDSEIINDPKGIFGGDKYTCTGDYTIKVVEPELVLLYWKFVYETTYYSAFAHDSTLFEELGNPFSNFYRKSYSMQSNWIEEVLKDNSYSGLIDITSWKGFADGNIEIPDSNKFYFVCGNHGGFYGNAFQDFKLSTSDYYFIFTNENFSE